MVFSGWGMFVKLFIVTGFTEIGGFFFIETIKSLPALMILLIKWKTHEGVSPCQAKENAISLM